MKIGKFLVTSFCLIASFLFASVFSCQKVDAIYYEASENKLLSYDVSRNNNKLTLSVQYQNGIVGLTTYICDNNTSSAQNCKSNYITKFVEGTFSSESPLINDSNEVRVFNPVYTTHSDGKPLNSYSDTIDSEGKSLSTYKIAVFAQFCIVAAKDDNGVTSCYNAEQQERPITFESFSLDQGITTSNEVNETLAKVLNVVNNIFIPILWGALGIFLIVKGILLGMDIVKSADDPDTRRRKVGGLVWLIIGVFIGYAVTILASYFMSMFGYGGYF